MCTVVRVRVVVGGYEIDGLDATVVLQDSEQLLQENGTARASGSYGQVVQLSIHVRMHPIALVLRIPPDC